MLPQNKTWLIRSFLFLLVAMLAGLMVSRAVVSIASMALVLFFFAARKGDTSWQRVLVGSGLLLLPVVGSGLWSSSAADWWRAVEVKLPLITIGLALATVALLRKQWKLITLILLGLVTAGSVWSAGMYLQHTTAILEGYLQARVLPTPLNDDHIRFSWLVVLTLICACGAAVHYNNGVRTLVIVVCGWLVVYLHLLSAKTGLLCLYSVLLMLAMHIIKTRNNKRWAVVIIAAMVAGPLLAYMVLPSFKNRVQYVMYDYSNYSTGNFMSGLSDGARVLSIKAGWAITRQHLVTGVGFGDIKPAVDKWHQQHYPHTQAFERFLPLNEWLLYGAGSGLTGMVLFTCGLIFLLRPLWRQSIEGRLTAVVLVIPLITDDTLESQFGVVIFIFVLMWMRLHLQLKSIGQ